MRNWKLVLCVVALAGCGGSEDITESPAPADSTVETSGADSTIDSALPDSGADTMVSMDTADTTVAMDTADTADTTIAMETAIDATDAADTTAAMDTDTMDAADTADGAVCMKPTNYALQTAPGQFASVPDSPTLRLTDVTIEVWTKFASVPGSSYACVVCKPYGTGSGDSWAIWYEGGGVHAGANPTNVGDAIGKTWSPTIGQWYHLAFTFDHVTKEQKLYVDGVLFASGTTTSSILYDEKPVFFGADIDYGSYSGFLDGTVDEVRIWDSVRPIEDIHKDLRTCVPGAIPGLAGYWPFDETTGQVIEDKGAGGNPGYLGSTNMVDTHDPTRIVSTVTF